MAHTLKCLLSVEDIPLCLKHNNKIKYILTQSNTTMFFIALVATSSGRYDHSTGQCYTKPKKCWLHGVHKMSGCIGSSLHQCQYLLTASIFFN